MTSCPCGSEDFTVTYQTSAQVTLSKGVPTAVTYGSDTLSQFSSTVTCTRCGTGLDLDNSLMQPAPEVLAVDEDLLVAALAAARQHSDAWADDLPTVTVRSAAANKPRTVISLPDSGALSPQ